MYEVDENGYVIEPEQLNQEYQSSFFLMLRYDILVDTRLTDFQKLLYAAITGLCKQKGYCWASNAYFEKLFNKGHSQVNAGISKLVELDYLRREMVYKKKKEKDGNVIETKQVSYRKLYVVVNPNQEAGIPENQDTGSPENQDQIDNPLIDNPTYNNSSKEECIIGVHAERGTHLPVEDSKYLDNNTIEDNLEEIGKKIGTDGIDVFSGKSETGPKHAAESQPKKKGKGGLAPLYDMVDERFPKDKYEDINLASKAYLKAHIGGRHLPSEDKWNEMLEFLVNESSIEVAGTSGKKFLPTRAMLILEKAIKGKDGIPYTDFDTIDGGLREPTVETNQRIQMRY